MAHTEALKLMRHAAELRSNIALMTRSPLVDYPTVARARQKSVHYLARNDLIYPPEMRRFGLEPKMPLDERKQLLSIPPSEEMTEEEEEFQQFLETGARKARKAMWIWRCGQQAREMQELGWYGFFVTLTVDPARVPDPEAMWRENGEWRRYIRRIARVSAKASGFPNAIKNGASTQDFVKYVGVIEHGSSRTHHHMHALIWLRDIPAEWKVCPNRGIRDPKYRVNDYCKPMGTFWPNSTPGIGRAKYFRHENDVWSRLGFSLPWNPKRERTITIMSAEKAGLYIAKYMDKEDKAWLHRVKATRNLGLNRLKRKIQEMAFSQVEALTWRPPKYSTSVLAQKTHTVPSALLRSITKQEIFSRRWASNSLDYPKLMEPPCESYSAMLKSVRAGTNVPRLSSREFYDFVTQHLPEISEYSESRYRRALTSLGVEFPPEHGAIITHTGFT